jgi:polar amino acid transport system substrate-binding protein
MGRRFPRVRRQAAVACLRAAVFGALVLTARAGIAAEPLRLCADPANLPFSSDKAATPGLYVEIGQAIAAALGRPTETVWSLTYFGKRNLRETLLAGHCDLAVGLPDDADFMGPRVIFSKPILDVGYALLVPKEMPVLRLDDLAGRRVAVQFASPPQSLLATRSDITSVTGLNPEEAVRQLSDGHADAAFIWGPSAGYLNHTVLSDAYRVIPVAGPGMQWRAAIGFSRKQAALRDAVNAVLPAVALGIPILAAKYALPVGVPIIVGSAEAGVRHVLVSDDAPPAGDIPAAPAPAADAPVAGAPATGASAAEGQELFNGTCAHCHGPDAVVAERRINLRLLHHRYGDQMDEVFHTTVMQGRPAKGMPSWSEVFTEDDFKKILAFLKTVQQG